MTFWENGLKHAFGIRLLAKCGHRTDLQHRIHADCAGSGDGYVVSQIALETAGLGRHSAFALCEITLRILSDIRPKSILR
jgi:hypothetical protein